MSLLDYYVHISIFRITIIINWLVMILIDYVHIFIFGIELIEID